MSGHSKWSTIKRKKGAKDMARSKLFSKLSRDIRVAVREGGSDPDLNFSLRLAMDKAKEGNMPADNVERAIKKASGELKTGSDHHVTYEAYGPGGSTVLIECATDNTNRTLTDVRTTLANTGGKLASEGSLSWQYDTIGYLLISPRKLIKKGDAYSDDEYEDLDTDELQMQIMEYPGVEDISVTDNGAIEVITEKTVLQKVRDQLMQQNIQVKDAYIMSLAQEELELAGEDLQRFQQIVESLEDLEDVDNVWSNVTNS